MDSVKEGSCDFRDGLGGEMMAVETPIQIDVCEELAFTQTEKEHETCFREEINVYSIPHSRMKRLAQMAMDKLKGTNYKVASELLTTVKTLSRVFYEFKTHERIENECIMRRLQAKLIKLKIENTAVCNCHKDDELSKMLKLFAEGNRISTKSETERENYGKKLERELVKFQQHFLPHMQEEEDVFQPLLVQYFSVAELKELKESVLKQHQMWNSMDNLEEMVTQYDDIPWNTFNGHAHDNGRTYFHGTHSHSSSSRSNKTQSGASSSSLHITRLFDEKSSVDIESLYYDSVEDSQDPGCGFITSKSLIEEKIRFNHLSGKLSPSPHGSLNHLPTTSRLHSPTKTNASTQQTFPFINLLPSEVLAQIFTYLTIRDLCRVSQVCRQWNAVALDANLWLTLAPIAWISSLKDEEMRVASWPNIETMETDSMVSAPIDRDDRLAFNAQDSDGTDSIGKDKAVSSADGSSQKSDSSFRREQSAIASIAYRLVPRIGTRVTSLILAGSRSITNILLRRILHHVPNLTYLDVRDTRIGDPAFKFINRRNLRGDSAEVGHCLGRLQYLNLSGCVNFTDEGLRLLISTMDGALDRLEKECEHSLCSTESRFPDDASVKSGQTGMSDLSSRRSRVESQFQGLVINEDQMQTMRRQKQQQQQQQQQTQLRQHRDPPSTKVRRETLRPPEAADSASTKSWDLESSGKLSMKKACASCVECPVTGSASANGSDGDEERQRSLSTATTTENGCTHGVCDREASSRPSRPLEFLSLSGCYRITDDGLWHLVDAGADEKVEAGLPRLKHLDLSGCMNISVEGLLPVLENCPLINFSHLFYCDNVFLGEGIDDLASGCRNLARGSTRVCCRTGQ